MIDQFFNVIDALDEHEVDYILIGGFAINLYGWQRGTQDIDLFVNPSESNIGKLQNALKALYDDNAINEITLPELNKYAVIRYGTPDDFYIDIITHIGERFSYNDLESRKIVIDGHIIIIATEETLIKLKSNTYREIDAADVLFLKKIIERRGN
jgi:predicted nucleotidyltransferase